MPQHDITTVDALRRQLHQAMRLEHATIPPYLTALYSLVDGENIAASQILRVVAVEEMLHLTLAANLLNAVGGHPDLTAPKFVPDYPSRLPDGEKDFKVGLRAFGHETLGCFLKIERPAMAPTSEQRLVARPSADAADLFLTHPEDEARSYYSIGEFYEAIEDGFIFLEDEHRKKGKTIFTGDPKLQITSEYYYSGGGKLRPVVDLESACAAIRLIIGQGEGELRGIFGEEGELAHFYRFDQLTRERYYKPFDHKPHDEPNNPTGENLHIKWNKVYPIKPNIKLKDFQEGSDLHTAALSFNKRYAEFLGFLTRAFNGEPGLLLQAVDRMFAFRDLINGLIRNPLPGTDWHAGPTFEVGHPGLNGKDPRHERD